MKFLLIGPPASGKGTIGKMLSEKLGIPLISGGAILREIPETHPRYLEVKSCLDSGDPAPKDFLGELHRERVSQEDCKNGFILDGWGRNLVDLKIFNPGIDCVIVFNLSRQSALKRITGRRLCDTDGLVYNIYTLPKEELEKCEGNLIQRDDDKEEVVNHRFDLYEKDTLPVVEYLKKEHEVIEIDAEPMPEEIFANVLEVLGLND